VCGEESTQHEKVAMGEVDEFDDSINKRVSERNERIQDSVAEAREGDLYELGWGFNKVNDEPEQCAGNRERRKRSLNISSTQLASFICNSCHVFLL
jgi:hypothetical protein